MINQATDLQDAKDLTPSTEPSSSNELASLVVEPASRGHSVATHMVDALLADERAPVYTLIDRRFVHHFVR
jgi:hypothetical protein